VCRRAERSVVALDKRQNQRARAPLPESPVDLLFVAARILNRHPGAATCSGATAQEKVE